MFFLFGMFVMVQALSDAGWLIRVAGAITLVTGGNITPIGAEVWSVFSNYGFTVIPQLAVFACIPSWRYVKSPAFKPLEV